jgi:hypothetical protein
MIYICCVVTFYNAGVVTFCNAGVVTFYNAGVVAPDRRIGPREEDPLRKEYIFHVSCDYAHASRQEDL